jgi:hypothetical protein
MTRHDGPEGSSPGNPGTAGIRYNARADEVIAAKHEEETMTD